MGVLYVSEYVDVRDGVPVEPAIATQVVTFSTTVASAAFGAETRFVRLHTDAICSVKFGASPSATTADRRLVAGGEELVAVPNPLDAGSRLKVAAVSNT